MASETLADIVAEMRKQARRGQHFDEATIFAYAEHIERAAEREREEVIAETVKAAEKSAAAVYEPHIHDTPTGNAAAMREALEEADKALSATSYGFDAPVRAQIRNVLAAPPRNCDRFADAPSAYADFIVPWKLEGHLDDVPTLQGFSNWLFAPAKEGGNDVRK